MLRTARSQFILPGLVSGFILFSCASQPPEEPVESGELAWTGGLVEGTANAAGVLKVANESSLDVLKNGVGLKNSAAQSIVAKRSGNDDLPGTADDKVFSTLAELDGVPFVSANEFALLLAYAISNGYVGCTPQVESPKLLVKRGVYSGSPQLAARNNALLLGEDHSLWTVDPATLSVSSESVATDAPARAIREIGASETGFLVSVTQNNAEQYSAFAVNPWFVPAVTEPISYVAVSWPSSALADGMAVASAVSQKS